MKCIVVTLFLISVFSCVHSMDLDLVPLLKKQTPEREEQENRRAMVRHMSPKLVLLSHAVSVPPDIWRQIYTKMVDVMFEGDKEFEEAFYKKPSSAAFQLYHEIKRSLGDEHKPIGPLYKLSQEDRDFILNELNPWHGNYVSPVISIEDQQKIHELDKDLQQYFVGKEVHVLDDEEMKRYKVTYCFVCGAPVVATLLGVFLESIFCCGSGAELACSPLVLGISFGMAPVVGCVFCFAGLSEQIAVQNNSSNKVTL